MREDFGVDAFSVSELKSIRSLQGRVKYCNSVLGKAIGAGSSRIVYNLGDGKCLKLAKNRKGLIQNEHEIQYDYIKDGSGLFPEKFRELSDMENFLFIVVEMCKPAKKADFSRLLGVSFDDFCQFLCGVYNNYARRGMEAHCRLSGEEMSEMWNNEDLYDFATYFGDYQLSPYEYMRIAQYGVAQRDGYEQIVILDDGVDDKILNDYYSRKRL